MTTLRALLAAALVVVSFGVAVAKLPPPPPMTDEQKAAAEEKKAKDAAAAEAAKAAAGEGRGSRRCALHRRAEGEGQGRHAADGTDGGRRGRTRGTRCEGRAGWRARPPPRARRAPAKK